VLKYCYKPIEKPLCIAELGTQILAIRPGKFCGEKQEAEKAKIGVPESGEYGSQWDFDA
jgi:hypothetical protein